jgi:ABC-type bacteriocin/lantibiotic exporter with double-glycine peptidase domain
LLLACEKLGVKTDLAALSKAAGTGARGTTMQGLKRAAVSAHLKAEGVQVAREALPDQPVSVAWFHGDHYVAVLGFNGRGESGTALIHDPNDAAPRIVSQESLLQSSAGVLLALHR